MSDELIKWLVGSVGVGGVVGILAILEIRSMRRELAESLRELRYELADALEEMPGWMQAIHSRLGSLGAESIPPPVASKKRHGGQLKRFQTAPTGFPVTKRPDDEETP